MKSNVGKINDNHLALGNTSNTHMHKLFNLQQRVG